MLEAVRFNHLEIIEMLLKQKEVVHRDVIDGEGWGALHIACYFGGTDAMEMLIGAGIPIEARGGVDPPHTPHTPLPLYLSTLA